LKIGQITPPFKLIKITQVASHHTIELKNGSYSLSPLECFGGLTQKQLDGDDGRLDDRGTEDVIQKLSHSILILV
jgi:hypothetical protein